MSQVSHCTGSELYTLSYSTVLELLGRTLPSTQAHIIYLHCFLVAWKPPFSLEGGGAEPLNRVMCVSPAMDIYGRVEVTVEVRDNDGNVTFHETTPFYSGKCSKQHTSWVIVEWLNYW